MLDKTARIAVLVSGGGTNLQAILDAQQSGIIKSGRVSLVISNNKDAYALTRAKNAGVECAVIEKTADFERNIVDCLERHGIDLIVLAGFMCILSKDFTARYSERIINVHPSLIPAFCGRGFYGLHVHEAALARGVKLTGATVHFVNEIPDGGRIIMQKAVDIEENDTPEILQKRVMENAEWIILPAAAEKVCKEIKERKNERI